MRLPHPKLSRDAAVLSVFHAIGLNGPLQMATAVLLARLPAVVAEASYWQPGRFEQYPMNLPYFYYEE